MPGFRIERSAGQFSARFVQHPGRLLFYLPYNNLNGYFITMNRRADFRTLAPQAARFRHMARIAKFRLAPTLAFPPTVRALTLTQRRLFLASLGSAAGFEEACAKAGIPSGAAVAERVRNPRFAREWDRHLDACIAQLETILVEKAMATLAHDFPGNDARDKWLVALVQWLLESRRSKVQRGRPSGSSDALLPGSGAGAAPGAASGAASGGQDDARKVEALIEVARARLLESEAQMARDGLAD